jgi:hypothetical protein
MKKIKKIRVAKGKTMKPKALAEVRKKAGSSNAGKYKDVAAKAFAGAAGGASKYSFPINSVKRAKSALKLAHNAPNPSGIKSAVYKKYPQLKKKKSK